MTGSGKVHTKYVNIVEDENTAEVASSYTSVTLAPNVHANFTEDISLFDMAGFDDSRNYIGKVGVSYFLNAVFQNVR